jgi:hypothetical protein
MFKKMMATTAVVLICFTSYGSKVKLYLGVRAGAGAMITRDQLNNFNSSQGPVNILQHHDTWSFHAKGEALLGFGRLRIGYQFLYNFSGPQISSANNYFAGDNNRNTSYFNSSQTHFFGHYFHAEIAIIDLPHFALTPGGGIGTFTGFKVDNTTGNTVQISSDTHNRFSASAELNAEIKFGRCVLLAGPNYYFFSLQDRANNNWREYQHFIGVDVGLRVNLFREDKDGE